MTRTLVTPTASPTGPATSCSAPSPRTPTGHGQTTTGCGSTGCGSTGCGPATTNHPRPRAKENPPAPHNHNPRRHTLLRLDSHRRRRSPIPRPSPQRLARPLMVARTGRVHPLTRGMVDRCDRQRLLRRLPVPLLHMACRRRARLPPSSQSARANLPCLAALERQWPALGRPMGDRWDMRAELSYGLGLDGPALAPGRARPSTVVGRRKICCTFCREHSAACAIADCDSPSPAASRINAR
jgi:hypothetical protein